MLEFDSPEIYRTVLEDLPTGVYMVDNDQRVRFWNSGAEQITGCLRQEMIGRLLPEIMHPTPTEADAMSDDDPFPLSAVIRTGRPIRIEAYMHHKGGHRIPVSLRVVPLRDAQEKIFGAAACFEENAIASEWTRRRNKLAELGCLDAETGIPNREFIQTRLHEYQDAFYKHHAPFGVYFITVKDMDHLRATYGPPATENVLHVVAQTLGYSLRPADCMGRWDDARFLVVIAECSEIEFGRIGERLRKIANCSEPDWWGDKLSVRVLLGGASAWSGDSIESILERAEKSLAEDVEKALNPMKV